ncbi:MAG: PEP-utilizing enzyme [Patescibacteria group bacterium]
MKNLFKSKTSYEILDLLTQNQGKTFYLSEIASKLSKDPANITRELTKLAREEVIKVISKGNKKYYGLNSNFNSAKELINLFNKNRAGDSKSKFETEWLLAEELKNTDPFFYQIFANCFVDEFASPGGRAYKKVVSVHKKYNLWFYYDKKDAYEVGEHLVDKFESDQDFMDKVNKEIVNHSDKLRQYVSKLPEDNLGKLSDKELWNLYKGHEDIHTEYYQWGWIPVAADMFSNNLTGRGEKILTGLGVSEKNIGQSLVILAQPEKLSLLAIEENDLIKIGIKIQEDKKQLNLFRELFKRFKDEEVKKFDLYAHSPEYEEKFEEKVRQLKGKIRKDILDDLESHYTKYFYTKFLFTEEQGIYSLEHYLKALVRLVSNNNNLAKAFKESEAKRKKDWLERELLIKKLKIEGRLLKFFNAWGEFMVTKIYRRYAQIFAIYRMVPVLSEIGRRLGLSLKEVKFMTSEEIYNGLFSGVLDKGEIKKRVNFSVYYTAKGEHLFYSGEEAKKIVKYIEPDEIKEVSEIKGQCGARGYAKGVVRIINVIRDMGKMKPGDILVSISTQPDLLPAMKKAAAFVTDQGGVTSHAAIVAREINTPCVIGTKIATKVLKDGDIVEVDADKGLVKILKKS